MIETRQPRIEAALDAVETERRILATEKRAFESFRSRLSALDSTVRTANASLATAGGPSTVSDAGADDALRRVRTAYRETVMDVPHYESEYGEPLLAHLTAEFGSELAECLDAESRLTPLLHGGLVDAADRAADERRRFLSVLQRERESLERVERDLDDCERRAVELLDRIEATDESAALSRYDAELAELERRCESLAADRQETIHDRSVATLAGVDGASLARYLYADVETTCPALADVSRCVETIRRARRRCLR
ncbi:MAG: hypothetical protein ABEJ78_09395 [Haloferacaceae archaeon]